MIIEELTTIAIDEKCNEKKLAIEYCDDVITIYYDNQIICSGDWKENIQVLFFKALQKWGDIK